MTHAQLESKFDQFTTQTRNTDTRNTDKRFPVAVPAQTTTITPQEADQLRSERAARELCSDTRIRKRPFAKFYYYASGSQASEAAWLAQCERDYKDWETARARGEIWAQDVPGESPDQVFRYFGGRVYKFSNGRPAYTEDWYAQWERGREERMKAKEDVKRLHEETPLGIPEQ